ncbi:MAG: AraC family transcriptional regulator [Victivallaceae bacterium]
MKILVLNTGVITAHTTGYHSHEYWQFDHYFNTETRLKVCLEGRVDYIDDTQAILIPPGGRHSIESFTPCKINSVKFMPEGDLSLFSGMKPGIIHIANYKDIFDALFTESLLDDMVETEIKKHFLYILVLRFRQEQEGSGRRFSQSLDPRINEAIGYINKNMISGNISLKKMASAAGMSLNHFIRVFQHEFGTTPMKFVRHLVIKKAIGLLAYSNLTLSQIAEMLNFPDQHTFSRSFKRETGLAPGSYRKKNIEPGNWIQEMTEKR